MICNDFSTGMKFESTPEETLARLKFNVINIVMWLFFVCVFPSVDESGKPLLRCRSLLQRKSFLTKKPIPLALLTSLQQLIVC